MSTEIERRLKVLEKKISHATPCKHPLAILTNPTEAQIDEMYEILENCPNCSIAPAFGPRMMIVRYPDDVILECYKKTKGL